MNILSLFDGISCARVALDRLGIKIDKYYASEIDKYAIQIALKNYPDTIEVGDITKLKGSGFQDIDLLIGGSPCQDLSIAGKRKGLSGERSGLFWEYVRLLNEIKPKYFILENVYSMSKENRQIITDALGVEPIMINASLVSAQNRKRLFWTNIPNINQPEDKGILLRDILEEGVDEKYYIKDKSNTIRTSGRGSKFGDKHCWDVVALTETRTEEAKRIRKENMKLGRDWSPRRGKELKPREDNKSNTITTGTTKESLILENSIIRKLTPIECERLMTLPDNYTEGISNTQRYKCLGNGFVVDVISHILKCLNKT